MPPMRRMSGAEARRLKALRQQAYRKQRGLCFWCNEMIIVGAEGDPRQCTADHLIPLHAGGRTRHGNIVAACARCNNERHPELNSMGVGIVATSGDVPTRSLFSVLAENKRISG